MLVQYWSRCKATSSRRAYNKMEPRQQLTIIPDTNHLHIKGLSTAQSQLKMYNQKYLGKPPSYSRRGLIYAEHSCYTKYLGNHLSRSCSISPMVESLHARITRLPRFKRDSRTDLRKVKVSQKKICQRNSSISNSKRLNTQFGMDNLIFHQVVQI